MIFRFDFLRRLDIACDFVFVYEVVFDIDRLFSEDKVHIKI